jgi:hypothetical protein
MNNYLTVPIRTALIPTDTYVACTVIDNADAYNQLDALVTWVKGGATSCEVKVEFSVDGTNYFREANATVTAGSTALVVNEYTFTTAGNYRIQVPISARFVKVSVKGTGTLTTSTVAVTAVLYTV